MKNLVKKAVLMVAMTIALVGNANEGLSFERVDGEIKTLLKIDDVKPGQLLSIIDINGLVIYKEHIKITGVYNKQFDLTALPNGNYFFEVDKGVAIKRIPFNVTLNNVTFTKENEFTIYKPVVRLKNNNLFVTRLSLENEPLEVEVYYENEFNQFDLIYNEVVENTKIFNRIYSLDAAKTGDYKIVFKSKNRVFTEKVKL